MNELCDPTDSFIHLEQISCVLPIVFFVEFKHVFQANVYFYVKPPGDIEIEHSQLIFTCSK